MDYLDRKPLAVVHAMKLQKNKEVPAALLVGKSHVNWWGNNSLGVLFVLWVTVAPIASSDLIRDVICCVDAIEWIVISKRNEVCS